jgi:hypothetical protein
MPAMKSAILVNPHRPRRVRAVVRAGLWALGTILVFVGGLGITVLLSV